MTNAVCLRLAERIAFDVEELLDVPYELFTVGTEIALRNGPGALDVIVRFRLR